jgi:hypothetical protein
MSQLTGQISNLFLERVKLMDLLAYKQLSSEVLVGIQQRACVLIGQLEKTEILSCKKTNIGLLCVLELTSLTDQEKVKEYSLINYDGV